MGSSSMRFAFILDPIERLLPHHDTSFALMLEAFGRGHEIYYVRLEDLFVHNCCGHASARRVEVMRPQTTGAPHCRLIEERLEPLVWFDAVFVRKDPPFDTAYLNATQVLSLVDANRTFIINDPRGLREANEK